MFIILLAKPLNEKIKKKKVLIPFYLIYQNISITNWNLNKTKEK